MVPSPHEPQRDQHAPIHRSDGGRRVVRPEAHRGRGQPRARQGLEDAPCELCVARNFELDERIAPVEAARQTRRDDHAYRVGDVHVVRRGHDHDVGLRSGKEPAELLHPGASHGCSIALVRSARLLDRDTPMRRDRGKHQRHARILTSAWNRFRLFD